MAVSGNKQQAQVPIEWYLWKNQLQVHFDETQFSAWIQPLEFVSEQGYDHGVVWYVRPSSVEGARQVNHVLQRDLSRYAKNVTFNRVNLVWVAGAD